MRLGAYPCCIPPMDSFTQRAYEKVEISERHRHRYEFNNKYRWELLNAGLTLAGLSPDGKLVEIVELPDHPWFVGVQFHPELKSRPNKPHPLFREFIAAAKVNRISKEGRTALDGGKVSENAALMQFVPA